MEVSSPRLIAFYLPQYYPIPENDAWWGQGFTEWTNVARARPLFKGHYQPHLPADLGYYDLRTPETRQAQADLAREYGIEGFCYWHYWFAGKRLLERPFNEVLNSGKPDYPFCLGWANQSWTGVWHGAPDRILMEQTYPGADDLTAHFNTLLPAFQDERYIKVDGKPIFVIYKPKELPEAQQVIQLWRNLATLAGLPGLFIIGNAANSREGSLFHKLGFDASIISNVDWGLKVETNPILKLLFQRFGKRRIVRIYQKIFKRPYNIFNYREIMQNPISEKGLDFECYPMLTTNWDNTPRSGLNGYIINDASPELFQFHLRNAIQDVKVYDNQHQLIFIKSWNEWAEGNYIEPDQKFGHRYLEAIRAEMK